jgi:putative membrane protein insertion efficiency factor
VKILLLKLIGFYRAAISPLLGQHCRFYPSCSCYAQEAITRFGASRGALLSLARLSRCHPFHPGGLDLVPESLPPPKFLPFKIREL